MPSLNRSLVRNALAVAAGILLAGAALAQDKPAASPAAAPAAAPDLSAKVLWLEKMVKYLQGEVTALRQQLRQQTGATGPGGAAAPLSPKALDTKIQELTKKLEGHTHEYLLEGRGADGSIQAVAQDRFPGSGLNSTGGARIGRAIIK